MNDTTYDSRKDLGGRRLSIRMALAESLAPKLPNVLLWRKTLGSSSQSAPVPLALR